MRSGGEADQRHNQAKTPHISLGKLSGTGVKLKLANFAAKKNKIRYLILSCRGSVSYHPALG